MTGRVRALAVSLLAGLLLAACGGSDTRSLDPTTTTARPTVSSQPSDQTYEGLVETLTKTGMTREQARCVVDKLSQASAKPDDPNSPEQRTRIEKLLADCKLIMG